MPGVIDFQRDHVGRGGRSFKDSNERFSAIDRWFLDMNRNRQTPVDR